MFLPKILLFFKQYDLVLTGRDNGYPVLKKTFYFNMFHHKYWKIVVALYICVIKDIFACSNKLSTNFDHDPGWGGPWETRGHLFIKFSSNIALMTK